MKMWWLMSLMGCCCFIMGRFISFLCWLKIFRMVVLFLLNWIIGIWIVSVFVVGWNNLFFVVGVRLK